MHLHLNWRRPLFYLLLPVLLFMAFTGFPPPLPPARPRHEGEVQTAPADEQARASERDAG